MEDRRSRSVVASAIEELMPIAPCGITTSRCAGCWWPVPMRDVRKIRRGV